MQSSLPTINLGLFCVGTDQRTFVVCGVAKVNFWGKTNFTKTFTELFLECQKACPWDCYNNYKILLA
jgi:hypothetical protein